MLQRLQNKAHSYNDVSAEMFIAVRILFRYIKSLYRITVEHLVNSKQLNKLFESCSVDIRMTQQEQVIALKEYYMGRPLYFITSF